jgi:transcriptional regulator of acetoin/glycerol metabolism
MAAAAAGASAGFSGFVDQAAGPGAPSMPLPAALLPPRHPEPAQIRSLEAQELDAIRQAVALARGNISEASKRLGISRNTIYRKLRWKAGSDGA